MVSSQHLRDKASRYYLLARSITSTRDIAHFEALGAEADQAAAEMEAEEDAAWLSSSNEQWQRMRIGLARLSLRLHADPALWADEGAAVALSAAKW